MPLRVMTFNVLHSSTRNLAAPWAARRPVVMNTIRSIQPDVACLQEVSTLQLEDLRNDLGEYAFLEGAPSGATTIPRWVSWSTPLAKWFFGDFYDRGELCPILLRRGRVTSTQEGAFHLHAERSKAFLGGPRTPHVVTWARVQDVADGSVCTVYNTHLGLVPWTARQITSDLVAKLDQAWNHEPQILTGDFNSTPTGPVVRALLTSRNGGPPAFRDSWIEAKRRSGSGRTFHWGFDLPGPRIDYILVRPLCSVIEAGTSSFKTGSIFASDHAAFTADLDLQAT